MKYRIVKNSFGYFIQRKSWWGIWMYLDSCGSSGFSIKDAKTFMTKQLALDAVIKLQDLERKPKVVWTS
jgi:hypothetical protein